MEFPVFEKRWCNRDFPPTAFSFLLSSALLFSPMSAANALLCPPYESTEERAAAADVIFVGLVEDVTEVGATGFKNRRTRFVSKTRIVEAIKGKRGASVRNVYFTDGFANPHLERGQQYLLFARIDGGTGELSVNVCTTHYLDPSWITDADERRQYVADQERLLEVLRILHEK